VNDVLNQPWLHTIVLGFLFGFGFAGGSALFNFLLSIIQRKAG
jgi:hypothetical protein